MKNLTYIKSITRTICIVILTNFTYTAFANGYNKTAAEYDKIIKGMYETQKIDSIKIILDEALKLYPNNTDLNRWAGTYFLQKKETANARYFLIKAVEQDDDNFLAKQQLVALEEELGNLSSAICYVNEMLELYPYDQALWKKKIGLYRKQGNNAEADRLLARLHTIYPNDSIVRNDYLNRMEETYMQQRKDGNRSEAIKTLRELLKSRSDQKAYYLELSNLLLQEGHSEEAVAVLSNGLEHFPSDNELLRKKAEIMAERGNNKEAVELLKKSKSTALFVTADNLMLEAARTESWQDPYTLYGRIYESRKSAEALDYLLRTAISRGYHEDALFYLSEYKKQYGTNTEILYKEYRIFKQIGDQRLAMRTLERYVSLNSTDREMANELAIMKTERATGEMANSNYPEAINELKEAIKLADESELQSSISRKLIGCYLNSNRHAEAISLIDSLRNIQTESSLYTDLKATAFHRMNQSDKALYELEQNGYANSETYETIATEYVKKLLEEGAIKKAYLVSKHWVETAPDSQQSLMYAINTSEGIKNYEDADKYIIQGRIRYPEESFFMLKEAASLYRNKEYEKGIELLTIWADSLPGNKEIVSAYSAHAEMRAEELLKEKKADDALSVIQHALSLDENNQSLLLVQGSAYEMKGDYEAAYTSYAKFKPEPLWVKEHRQKLMAVRRKGFKNTISTDVLTGWYSDGKHPNTILSAAYSRKMKKDNITITANISCRNTDIEDTEPSEITTINNDNTGLQLRADWGHTFNDRWATTLTIAGANSIFPSWLGQAGVFYTLPKDVELGISLGYRKNYTPQNILTSNNIEAKNMYNIRLSGNVYRDLWRINTNCDGFMLNNSMYFNVNSQFRYYPRNDGNTHLMVSAGVGTAPEIDFVDKLMPGSFENVNVSLGLGGVYMISSNLSLGLTASYHYFYNQATDTENENTAASISTNYKNLYDIYAQIIFCF